MKRKELTRSPNVQALKDNQIACRDYGHAWQKDGDTNIATGLLGQVVSFNRQLRCVRCGTIRRDAFAVGHGRVDRDKRYYTYQNGYLLDQHADRSTVRLEGLLRVLDPVQRRLLEEDIQKEASDA